MDFRIDFGDVGPQDVTVTLIGKMDAHGVTRCNIALSSDTRFRPGLAILVDCTNLDTQIAEGDQALEALASPVVERDWHNSPLAIAFVARNAESVADLVIWRAHLGGSHSKRSIFPSREEAIIWLEAQRRKRVPATPR